MFNMSSNQSSLSTYASIEECCCSCSAVQFDEVKYTWKIHNFSSIDEAGNYVKSPTFTASTSDKFQWYLNYDPTGEGGEKHFFGLYLHLSYDSTCKKALAKFNFSLLSNGQKESYVSDLEYYMFNIVEDACGYHADADNWGWTNFLKKDETFRNTFLPNDTLTISFKMTFFELNDRILNKIFRPCSTIHLQQLSENLSSSLENHEFADFAISLKEKDYPVHKVILAARSNYFAKMFKSGMIENEQNRVEITDVKEDVMDEMLKFIYTGKCENVDKLADGLLAAADKYDIDQLKRTCLKTISKSISVDNAPNLLVLADLYHENELKSKVIDFILTKSVEIRNSRAWNNIMPMYPKLLNEVCNAAFLRLPDASGSGDK